MAEVNIILNSVRDLIKLKLDIGTVAFDNTEVVDILSELNRSHLDLLKNEIQSEYSSRIFVNDRFHSIYLQSLIWFVSTLDVDFVLKLSSDAIDADDILNKQPWIEILHEFDNLEKIALFFAKNQNYGDKYTREKLLYILSDTNVLLGDRILDYLKSQEEILSAAAIVVMDSQNLTQYLDDIVDFFNKSENIDLFIDCGMLLAKWHSNPKPILTNKINSLLEKSSEYYQDSILELQEILEDL